jgi:2-polyprenyl-3-methyl-5-hydroxy-6-metoxy-1,4-benzoquinol methylase
MNILSEKETFYLTREYEKVEYGAEPITSFLGEIFDLLKSYINMNKNLSLLDIGCGKGYFLRHLHSLGYKKIKGIDPCKELIENRLFPGVTYGTFEENNAQNDDFDIVFTCHTLHHLKDSTPLYAIREMTRIARKYIVVIEINNSNIPMLFVSLLNYNVEKNAFRYNLNKVKKMITQLGLDILYAGNIKAGFISGNSILHKMAYRIGGKPYNIVIARKV